MAPRLAQSYSFWLMLSEPEHSHFQALINNAAKVLGGPLFVPHITLAGGFSGDPADLATKLEMFVESVNVFEITFGGLATTDSFFESLFVRIVESDALMALRKRAYRILSKEEPPYRAHMSLAYGDYTKDAKLESIWSKLFDDYTQTVTIEKIALAYNDEVNLEWKVLRTESLRDITRPKLG